MAKLQSISWQQDIINIAYGNGQIFMGDCNTLPANIYQPCDASRHGISQKLGDAKSGGTASEKYAEVLEIWSGLQAGNWNRKGGTDETVIRDAYLVLAHQAGMKGKAAEEKAATWFTAFQALNLEGKDRVLSKDAVKLAIQKVKADRKLGGQKPAEDFDPNL